MTGPPFPAPSPSGGGVREFFSNILTVVGFLLLILLVIIGILYFLEYLAFIVLIYFAAIIFIFFLGIVLALIYMVKPKPPPTYAHYDLGMVKDPSKNRSNDEEPPRE